MRKLSTLAGMFFLLDSVLTQYKDVNARENLSDNPSHSILAIYCAVVQVWFYYRNFCNNTFQMMPNNLKLRILGNHKKLASSQSWLGAQLSAQFPLWKVVIGISGWKLSKTRYQKFSGLVQFCLILVCQIFCLRLPRIPCWLVRIELVQVWNNCVNLWKTSLPYLLQKGWEISSRHRPSWWKRTLLHALKTMWKS